MLRFLSAGESHGNLIMGILEGIPSNLILDEDYINNDLKRRQKGYGRSPRMNIERDKINFLSGLDNLVTTGAPIGFYIENLGKQIKKEEFFTPRPGHCDLSGILKYNQPGGRNILERASARETAIRVAVGGMCKILLNEFGITINSHVTKIGGVSSSDNYYNSHGLDFVQSEKSILSIIDKNSQEKAMEAIDLATKEGYSLGGEIQLIAGGIPVGLGSHIQWDRKLDGEIGKAVLSIPGIKAVEFGIGSSFADSKGSNSFDEISYNYEKGYYRNTNRAGGIEGGISNGEDIVLCATMKPIPTQRSPLNSVDMITKTNSKAFSERADICAVPAAAVVVEAMVSYVLAKELLNKFGGDSMEELRSNYNNYTENIIKMR